MSRIFLMSVLFLSFFAFSCKDPVAPPAEKGKIRFSMHAGSGDSTIEINKEYTFPNGQKYSIEMLKFYLSDISLVKDDGSKTPVKDLLLIDLGKPLQQPYDANAIGTDFTFEVPAGNYKAVEMGIGVPKSINVVSNNYKNEHPLSIYRGTDWAWAGYRFIILQGQARNENNELKSFKYHIAGDTFYQAMKLEKNITVTAGQSEDVSLKVDMNKLFQPADATPRKIDPITENITHSESSGKLNELAWKVNRNFLKAIGL